MAIIRIVCARCDQEVEINFEPIMQRVEVKPCRFCDENARSSAYQEGYSDGKHDMEVHDASKT